MKKIKLSVNGHKAFTLVEMIVAITVFTIFIGFAMVAFITFHRAQQEIAISRGMLLEMDETIGAIASDIKESSPDFSRYSNLQVSSPHNFKPVNNPLIGVEPIFSNSLYLQNSAHTEETEYSFDAETGVLTVQKFDIDANGELIPQDGFLNPIPMHSNSFSFKSVEFRIVPGADPYNTENILSGDDSLWYQPNVQISMTGFTMGKIRDEIVVDLVTSVTSRIYK